VPLFSFNRAVQLCIFEQTQGLILELHYAEVRDEVFASKGLPPISKKSRKEIKYQQSLGNMTAEHSVVE